MSFVISACDFFKIGGYLELEINMKVLCHILALVALVVAVSGHGRVLNPPSRASMWRNGYKTQPNYDDNGLNCGGFGHQYYVNNGKCGICGDPFDQAQPRHHELGGRYGSGIIVAEYKAGQVFTVTVEITAYHMGYWYFNICPDPYSTDQSCFDKNPVELEKGGTKFYPSGTGVYKVNYRMPYNISCTHCVLQWWYKAGNNWGVCDDGTQALGCGKQEHFGACTDITIKPAATVLSELIPPELTNKI